MISKGASEYRIALLIDADNSHAGKIEVVLSELSKLGGTNIRRAYGNWKKTELKAWEDRLHEFAIRPMQQFDYSKGKNASDMAMVVDAMELLYVDQPQAFAIVSSDADFTPLVMHLKSKGAVVYGFGQKHTPEPFVKACTKFLFLEQLTISEVADALPAPANLALTKISDVKSLSELESSEALSGQVHALAAKTLKSATPVTKPTLEQLRRDNKLIVSLRESVAAVEEESGWSKVGAVGSHMANKSSFDARNHGYATLTKLLVAKDAFELKDEGTSQVCVKIRRHPIANNKTESAIGTGRVKVANIPKGIADYPKISVSPPQDCLPIDEVEKILLAIPAWEVGEAKKLSSVGEPLRESSLKRIDEALHVIFLRHPEYFQVMPTDPPTPVTLTKKP